MRKYSDKDCIEVTTLKELRAVGCKFKKLGMRFNIESAEGLIKFTSLLLYPSVGYITTDMIEEDDVVTSFKDFKIP